MRCVIFFMFLNLLCFSCKNRANGFNPSQVNANSASLQDNLAKEGASITASNISAIQAPGDIPPPTRNQLIAALKIAPPNIQGIQIPENRNKT